MKDMSKVYAEMLTKELVGLRSRKTSHLELLLQSPKRVDKKEAINVRYNLQQIDHELAERVAAGWMVV